MIFRNYFVNKSVKKVLEATPEEYQQPIIGHYPVPYIYEEWIQEVIERFDVTSIAQFNEHLYEDIPPCKNIHPPSEGFPENSVLQELINTDPELATKVVLKILSTEQTESKLLAIDACQHLTSSEFTNHLVYITRKALNRTDRAFAYREIVRRQELDLGEILKEGLFDDYHSIRLLCMEWLVDTDVQVGDYTIIVPIQPRNPFHYYFLERALSRLLPGTAFENFFNQPHRQQVEMLHQKNGIGLTEYLNLALHYRYKPFASMVIYLLGNEEQAIDAIRVLEQELLEQGRQRQKQQKDKYHSQGFWVGTDMIQAFQAGSQNRLDYLVRLLSKHVQEYSPEKDKLLSALTYVFQFAPHPKVEQTLVEMQNLKTDYYDLYMGAAAGLAGLKSPQAFPALLKILLDERQPFASLAIKHLETLTGIETPDKPDDLGILHNIGLPKIPISPERAYKFWHNWYQKNKDNLKFDDNKQQFFC